jgi:cystathionine beta-lyase
VKYNFDEIIDRTNSSSIKYDFRKVLFGTENLIPMWVADMDFRTPDFILNALKKRIEHPVLGYSLKPEGYYDAIINWLKIRHHWDIEKSWITFSPGVVPGLTMSVLAFTNPGDKVIVQPPVYFPFFSSIQGPGRELVYNPLKLVDGRYYMNFDDLKNKIDTKTKMLFLCNPHNPGGMVWKKDELLELAQICLENDVLIVSDEIHSDLTFKPHYHIPLASLSPEIGNQVITFMAPSKTFNIAGLATSFALIKDPGKIKIYNKTLDDMHLQIGNIFGNVALEAAYTHGQEWLVQLLAYLQENVEYVIDFLDKINFPKIKAIRPEGTYMLWLDCRELGLNDKKLKTFMNNKAGLGLNDGIMFGKEGSGFQRINIACPKSVVEEAMHRLARAVNNMK